MFGLLDKAMSVATGAMMGYLVSIPGLATVGAMNIGGVIGAATLMVNPTLIFMSFTLGAILLSPFFLDWGAEEKPTPTNSVERVWASVKIRN
ncbi:hypothetical protein NG798_27410 [Ancylothrix sp. C2]|uniref:hypothetical protein n=1 Tax=Ancylothrix sp. D3o TaxID=2953691 RepID=UPI0021BAF869|nr:hypothetical protein [Ancylothrix sp. D3o]MCT7953529.1 hypothetical protein [Ancylothrix sp. D3o]